MFAEVKDATIVNNDNVNAYYGVSLKDYSLAQLKVDHHFVKATLPTVRNMVFVHLTAKQQKVLEFCDEIPRTAQEILEMVGVWNTKLFRFKSM